jgi:SAM-dependent methyltransferase
MARDILDIIRNDNGVELSNCIDVGCGPGWFTKRLIDYGLSVVGIDARAELIEVARGRVPEGEFYQVDVESKREVSQLSHADLIFCFGLLYHVESPFRVIRNLQGLTKTILFIESIVIPEKRHCALLVEENKNETQGLTGCALIPTGSCITKLLYSSGFEYVYEYMGNVDHKDFIETEHQYKRRRVFIGSNSQLTVSDLGRVPDVTAPKYDFLKAGKKDY